MGRPEKNPISLQDRFGSLTVVSLEIAKLVTKYAQVKQCICICDCGSTVTVKQSSLKTGNTRSCGCQGSRTTFAQRIRRHGLTAGGRTTCELAAFYRAVQRCENPNDKKYPRYGGRGITVHEEWRRRPELFVLYVGPRPSARYSLHRIDNDGNYEPGNVKWATTQEQNRSRSNNRLITWNGETRCVREWEDTLGFKRGVLNSRLYLGWTGEKLFSPQQFQKGGVQ